MLNWFKFIRNDLYNLYYNKNNNCIYNFTILNLLQELVNNTTIACWIQFKLKMFFSLRLRNCLIAGHNNTLSGECTQMALNVIVWYLIFFKNIVYQIEIIPVIHKDDKWKTNETLKKLNRFVKWYSLFQKSYALLLSNLLKAYSFHVIFTVMFIYRCTVN